MWVELGESVCRAGLRKLVFVNSHGGNTDLLSVVARELRVRHDMLVVTTSWRRFGLPDRLFTPAEAAHGIHAGDIETSLMLDFCPDLVRMDKARDFVSNAQAMEGRFKHLRPTGSAAFGWMASDLNPDGAVGDASIATAEKGRLTAKHQALGFIDLLRDIAEFPLTNLG
jgi:creatinine amidohydrolase